tara:strand:- start:7990 stop:8646 length:657 start_codon:yes stop_codon:yes gene_type:complete
MDIIAMPEADFKKLIKRYLIILACKFVDDETSFIKHLQKQANANNTDAIEQLSVIKQFDTLLQHIQKTITEFGVLGYQRISKVCLAIHSQAQLPFSVSHHWNVCSLSGINTNNSCVLKGTEPVIHIDHNYACFASMLWLVTHMPEMEYSRINHFLNHANTNDSIKQIMQKYLETDTFTTDTIIDMYYTAFKIVHTVFKNTMTQIERDVCGHPEHAVRV